MASSVIPNTEYSSKCDASSIFPKDPFLLCWFCNCDFIWRRYRNLYILQVRAWLHIFINTNLSIWFFILMTLVNIIWKSGAKWSLWRYRGLQRDLFSHHIIGPSGPMKEYNRFAMLFKVLIGAYEDTEDCRERPDTIGLVLTVITLTLRWYWYWNWYCDTDTDSDTDTSTSTDTNINTDTDTSTDTVKLILLASSSLLLRSPLGYTDTDWYWYWFWYWSWSWYWYWYYLISPHCY